MIVERFKINGIGCVQCPNCKKLFGVNYISNFNNKQGTEDYKDSEVKCPYCKHISNQYTVKDVMFWKVEQE